MRARRWCWPISPPIASSGTAWRFLSIRAIPQPSRPRSTGSPVILRFEPRILANTLQVEAVDNDNMLGWHNVVSVKISAQVWAQPVPLELLLRTEVDLETGQVALAELAA